MKSGRKRRRSSPENRGRTREANLARGAAFRWQKGQSGNPGGRPAFAKLSEACREILSSPLPSDLKKTVAQGIAEKLAQAALRGSISAAAELCDRAEGRAVQAVALESKNDRLKQLLAAFNEAHKEAEAHEESDDVVH